VRDAAITLPGLLSVCPGCSSFWLPYCSRRTITCASSSLLSPFFGFSSLHSSLWQASRSTGKCGQSASSDRDSSEGAGSAPLLRMRPEARPWEAGRIRAVSGALTAASADACNCARIRDAPDRKRARRAWSGSCTVTRRVELQGPAWPSVRHVPSGDSAGSSLPTSFVGPGGEDAGSEPPLAAG